MNRLDRALGILLLLRSGQSLSAAALAERFEVSTRTIYRDVETLSLVGVPVYAEMGRGGGFRLGEGYFLPPVMLSVGEAISLVLGLTLLRQLRAKPFAPELESAAHKLVAAVPERIRAVLAESQRIIGVEAMPADIFHPEPPPPPRADGVREDEVVGTFLRAILDRRSLALQYRSPYRDRSERLRVTPLGLLWDRDYWYLVGSPGPARRPALWRADRVQAIEPDRILGADVQAFDVASLLGRGWLRAAMSEWLAEPAPVRIRMTAAQADRLRQDWYYAHAHFEPGGAGHVIMSFGEGNPQIVLELVRWLGPGAELLEPPEWRAMLQAELRGMLARYMTEQEPAAG